MIPIAGLVDYYRKGVITKEELFLGLARKLDPADPLHLATALTESELDEFASSWVAPHAEGAVRTFILGPGVFAYSDSELATMKAWLVNYRKQITGS